MIDDDIRALRGALADGPTPGPWESLPVGHGPHYVARVNNREVVPPDACELAHEIVDARYIAAASPDRIARLLDEIERLRAENDLLRTENDEAAEIVADLKAEVSAAAREAQTLRNQRDELRIILDKRPAMNDGLREAYAKWSAGVYALDWMDAADIDAACKEEGK